MRPHFLQDPGSIVISEIPVDDSPAVVLKSQRVKSFEIEPKVTKPWYAPGTNIAFTIAQKGLHRVNFGKSETWVKLSFYSPHDFQGCAPSYNGYLQSTDLYPGRILANGAVSLVHRFTITSGSKIMEDNIRYNVDVASDLECVVPEGYVNHITGFGTDQTSRIYTDHLHRHNPESEHGPDGWSYSVWLKIPQKSFLGKAGYFNLWQMTEALEFKYGLAKRDEPLATFSNCPTIGYLHDANAINEDWLADSYTKWSTNAPVSDLTDVNNTWEWRVDDMRLLLMGLEALPGATMVRQEHKIYAPLTTHFNIEISGGTSEKKRVEYKRGSVTKVKMMFIYDEAYTEQTAYVSDISQYYRASMHSDSNTGELHVQGATEVSADQANRYRPWVNYWNVSVGGEHFPVQDGVQVKSPNGRNDNVRHWYKAYLDAFKRSGAESDLSSRSLRPYDEYSHSLIHKNNHFIWADRGGNAPKPGAPNWYDKTMFYTNGDLMQRVGGQNRVAYTPTFSSSALCLYSGDIDRFCSTDARGSSDIEDMVWANQRKVDMPGCKFIMIASMTATEDVDRVIQGTNTKIYDPLISWGRSEIIDVNRPIDLMGEAGFLGNPGINAHVGGFRDRIPRLNVFFTADAKFIQSAEGVLVRFE